MRLRGEWLENPDTQAICSMLTSNGYQALFVGGCVRNALYVTPVNDIDIATDATPDRVLDLAEELGLHAIPTGIEHGTVTVIANHEPHEITTFRKDVETDGRRAVVEFSKEVEDDARRRDFTMNAIYATPNGEIVDPLGGLSDLYAKRVRFIDDAQQRIREDYLRILRFFRFHAFYGDPDAGMDVEALSAIAENVSGIETLSNERIGAEITKLLAAPDPAPSVAAMRSSGALGWVFEGADDRFLAPLVHVENQAGIQPDSLRRLAALGGERVAEALRLSKKSARRLEELRAGIESSDRADLLGYRHGYEVAVSIVLLRAAVFNMPIGRDSLDEIHRGTRAVFPISADSLMPDFEGPALGRELKRLEALWLESGFKLGKADLLKA